MSRAVRRLPIRLRQTDSSPSIKLKYGGVFAVFCIKYRESYKFVERWRTVIDNTFGAFYVAVSVFYLRYRESYKFVERWRTVIDNTFGAFYGAEAVFYLRYRKACRFVDPWRTDTKILSVPWAGRRGILSRSRRSSGFGVVWQALQRLIGRLPWSRTEVLWKTTEILPIGRKVASGCKE